MRRALPSRDQLAALPVVAEAIEHLSEPGFEGPFVFKAGDYTAQIAADPTRATYVAPSRALDGSAGAWVRQSTWIANVAPPAVVAAQASAEAAATVAVGSAGAASTSANSAAASALASSASATASANSAASAAASKGYATKALMDADLIPADGAVVLVTNDATTTNNGAWRKNGASGAGSWVQAVDRVAAVEAVITPLVDKIGSPLVTFDAVYGNPIVTGSGAAPGSVWADYAPFLKGGQLKTLELWVNAVGNGTGKFVILKPSGANWQIVYTIPITGVVGTGAKTFTAGANFTGVAVQAGWILGFHAATGGITTALAATGGTSRKFDTAAVAVNDTFAMTTGALVMSIRATVATMTEIIEDRLDALDQGRSAILASAQRDATLAAVPGSTSYDTGDTTFTKIYASEPSVARGFVSDVRMRFTRAGTGEIHVLQPDGAGTWTNVGVYPVTVAAGEASVFSQLPSPLWIEKGARIGYKPITGIGPRIGAGGRNYSTVGNTGLGATGITLTFENIGVALAVSVKPPKSSAVRSAIIDQKFTGTASYEWVATGWTWGAGLVSPGTPAWTTPAYLNKYTSSSKRFLRGRFVSTNATNRFGLAYYPNSSFSTGSACVVDQATSKLQLYNLTTGGATLAKEVTIPWAIPQTVEIHWERSGMAQTATLYDPVTQNTVVLTQTQGDGSAFTQNFGRPGVIHSAGVGGTVTCKSLRLSRTAPKRLQALVFGDSIGMGNGNGANWASNWPYALDAARGKNDVVNASLGGSTSSELNTRLGFDTSAIVNADIDLASYDPAYVVLALGVNDLDQAIWRLNMIRNISAVLGRDAVPILATITPYPVRQALINLMNADIMSGYFGAYDWIDFAAAVSTGGDRITQNTSLFEAAESPNYLHPNAAGHARMFQQILIDTPYLIKDPEAA